MEKAEKIKLLKKMKAEIHLTKVGFCTAFRHANDYRFRGDFFEMENEMLRIIPELAPYKPLKYSQGKHWFDRTLINKRIDILNEIINKLQNDN